MDTPAKTSRTNLAIQVIQETNKGLTVVAACKEVGLARSSFYEIYRKNPEVFIKYQQIVEASERAELVMIASTQLARIKKIIEDAIAEGTSPRDRVTIAKFLFEKMNELEGKYTKGSSTNKSAKDILTGPVQRHIESRI
jgi:hypothetical protein